MTAKTLYNIALLFALIPMITGTVIFWGWYHDTSLPDLELWGIITIMVSIPICIVGLVLLFIFRKKNKGNPIANRKALKVIFLTLFNIPLAICYFWFASYILCTERITINNNSDFALKDIEFFGAGASCKIDQISKGTSKTIWVYMTSDGAIQMKFNKNRKVDTVFITGYTGPLMGGNEIEYDFE